LLQIHEKVVSQCSHWELIFGIELAVQWFAQRDALLALEFGSRHALSSVTGALNDDIHQLEHGPLTGSTNSFWSGGALLKRGAVEALGR